MGTFQFRASDSMVTLPKTLNHILISIVNIYSMNLPHISSSPCDRFVPKSSQFAYYFDTHIIFFFHITGDTLLVTHRGLLFNSLEFVKF